MEGLQIRVLVTNEMIYLGTIENTPGITPIFPYKKATKTMGHMLNNHMFNFKEFPIEVRDMEFEFLVQPLLTTREGGFTFDKNHRGQTRITLWWYSHRDMYADGLKKVVAFSTKRFITGIFEESFYDSLDKAEIRYFVAAILSCFNLCDSTLGIYPNVYMGFSIIISNFEYDFGVLPPEFPQNEFKLKYHSL